MSPPAMGGDSGCRETRRLTITGQSQRYPCTGYHSAEHCSSTNALDSMPHQKWESYLGGCWGSATPGRPILTQHHCVDGAGKEMYVNAQGGV